MSNNPVLSLCKRSTEGSATPGEKYLKYVSKLSVGVTFTVLADVYNRQGYFKLGVFQFTYLQESSYTSLSSDMKTGRVTFIIKDS